MLFENGAGFCPWHKSDSSFKAVLTVSPASPYFHHPWHTAQTPRADPVHNTSILVMECLHCRKSVVLLEMTTRLPAEEPGGEEEARTWRAMVSPHASPRELHESAPETVRSLFAEASACEKANAFRAAGVMYRAAVEELVKDRQATGTKLYHQIESLKGRLSDELVEDLHEARMLGNDSIHAGITYSQEEVEDVAGLIEEAVLELYVQPEQKRAMRDARRARREK